MFFLWIIHLPEINISSSSTENRKFMFVTPDITVNLFINLTVLVTRFFCGETDRWPSCFPLWRDERPLNVQQNSHTNSRIIYPAVILILWWKHFLTILRPVTSANAQGKAAEHPRSGPARWRPLSTSVRVFVTVWLGCLRGSSVFFPWTWARAAPYCVCLSRRDFTGAVARFSTTLPDSGPESGSEL